MSRKQKLELTWIGKDDRPQLEPRILLEDPEISYNAAIRSDTSQFDNMLIEGDNLLALKALENEFFEKVKCIYIDPPYNTGSAFDLYDDGVEHSLWLSLIRERLTLLWKLLRKDGSIWISIDDREMPYLRVVLDEVCGRRSFVAQIVWQKRYSRDNNSAIGDVHEYVVVYAKDPDLFKTIRNLIPLDEKARKPYSNPNDDPRGPWQSISFTGEGYRANMMYPIQGPNGQIHRPPEGRHWAALEPEYLRLKSEGRVWFGRDGSGVPRIIRYLSEVPGLVPWTWWPHEDVGHTDEAKKESHQLFGKDKAFPTPKPERLISRIIDIASNPGEIVLDSFAGSGTTGAVAHKMGRRWIMVEAKEHCRTHIVPRLRRVVDGEDQGGVTVAAGWKGGGGFRFCRLAPSLLERDRWDNWIVSRNYNPIMLAEAMCKHMGFTYEPSQDAAEYWKHGYSTERDFIYVTTQAITHGMLAALSHDVGPDRHLLICCKAYSGDPSAFDNITVRKIPQAVLANCEWGRDDYSLRIAALPVVEADTSSSSYGDTANGDGLSIGQRSRKRRSTEKSNEATLFDATAGVGK